MLAGDRTDRPRLVALEIGARREAWQAVGFAVSEAGTIGVGDVLMQLTDAAPGIRGWRLDRPVAGLPVADLSSGADAAATPHPNGVLGIDHVVIASAEPDVTSEALVAVGCEVRGERTGVVGGNEILQRFLPLQNALVELVSGFGGGAETTGASFWGVTFICPDLGHAVAQLGPHVGEPRPAVQPGRLIATADSAAELGTRVAFMTPRHR